MKRKWLTAACLWIALFALVLLYTDREEYVWSFSGDSLSALLETREEAAQRQADWEAMMDRERAAARARGKAGLWGADETENVYAIALPAVTEDGLNLMWGEYEAEVSYSAKEDFTLGVAGAGRQLFIRGGETALRAGEKMTETFRFTLTDSAEHLRLAADLPEGAVIHSVTVRKCGTALFSRDLAAWAVLLGIVLTVLLFRLWETGEEAAERRRDTMILVLAAAFACMPLLWDGLQEGHDLTFHLNRIEGIASALRCGQFPARIHASTLQGYGYAASVFYPELFLYIPAVLRNLGVSLLDAWRVFLAAVHLLCAWSCYTSARRLLGSRKQALAAGVLYTLSIYRLVNAYVRATPGESLAMIFFPVLVLAMAEVLERNEKKWPLLALAMTGILMSHLLSALFAAVFCALAALLSFRKLLREPRRILSILAAAGLTILCSLWFFVPMVQYLREPISTSVMINSAQHVLKLGSYLVTFSGNNGTIAPEREDFAYTIGVVPGIALMAGLALYAVRRYAHPETKGDRLSQRLLLLGGLALLGAMDFFPWRLMMGLPKPYSTFFMQIQFPWRLVGVAVPMLVLVAAKGFTDAQKHGGLALMAALAVLTGGYTMQCFVQQEPVIRREGYVDSRIKQYEYTYVGTEKEALSPGEIRVAEDEPAEITDYEKRGTNLRFTIVLPNGGKYVDLPLLYYPGYHAAIEGRGEVRVKRGGNNQIRLFDIRGERVQKVSVWYAEPVSWRIAEAASVAGFLLLAVLLRRRRGGGAA